MCWLYCLLRRRNVTTSFHACRQYLPLTSERKWLLLDHGNDHCSSITPCMLNSQVSLPFIFVDIWKFVEVHHGWIKQNWLQDFKLIESTCLIRWPMRRLFSRIVKYAEWENPVTTTKASSRIKKRHLCAVHSLYMSWICKCKQENKNYNR